MGKHKDSEDKKDKKDKKKKKHRKDKDRDDRKRSKKDKKQVTSSSSEESEEEQWVEKPSGDDSLDHVSSSVTAAPSLRSAEREQWMTAPRNDFDFTGMGQKVERKSEKDIKREEEEKRRSAIRAQRELNPYFKDGGDGLAPEEPGKPAESVRRYEYGDSGSNWRMMKLKRILETAEQEGRPVKEVALERYGSLEDYQEAQAERAYLDERRGGSAKDEFGRDIPYRPTVRKSASFQKPGSSPALKRSMTPADDVRSSKRPRQKPVSSPSAPIMSRISSISTMPIQRTTSSDNSGPVLSKDELNKLNSKVLRAKLMGLPEASELEAEFEKQKQRAESRDDGHVVLPSIDSRGRLLDIGSSSPSGAMQQQRRKPKPAADTHDEQGNRIRYGTEDDKLGLADLIMQEKMAGAHDMDAHMADRIARDSTFNNNLDYIDDNVDKLSGRKQHSDDQKRRIAVNDYQKHEKAVAKCPYCLKDGNKPKVPVIALGNKSYLALPEVIDMVPGHCLIVPVDHVLTTLECDDDTWDEIRNFQKCLMQMFAEQNQGVIFMEQVINFKWHKHTVIECIPLPMEHWEDAAAYFKEAILSSDDEWTQHRKLIDTSKNGFRRSMVKNLPYFHVWFDPNRGYGHIIENSESWREWFGREVLASVLDLSPDKWRKPRRINPTENGQRMTYFLGRWKKYDWTAMLEGGDY